MCIFKSIYPHDMKAPFPNNSTTQVPPASFLGWMQKVWSIKNPNKHLLHPSSSLIKWHQLPKNLRFCGKTLEPDLGPVQDLCFLFSLEWYGVVAVSFWIIAYKYIRVCVCANYCINICNVNYCLNIKIIVYIYMCVCVHVCVFRQLISIFILIFGFIFGWSEWSPNLWFGYEGIHPGAASSGVTCQLK